MRKKTLRIITSLLSLALVCALLISSVCAYSLTGQHISSTISYTPYNGFGTTTISHFNEALWQWNSNSGLSLMNRKATARHYSTNYPTNDGNSYIYAVNTGSNTYVAENTWRYNTSTNVITESDINLNMYHSWANSAQPGKYDVWSVFLHEAGHTAGLADLYSSSYSSSVMYGYSNTNTLKRYLAQDDINGLTAIYGSSRSSSSVISDETIANYQMGENLPESICVRSGALKEFTYDDLLNNSTLIVQAKLTGKSDSFKIKPVFGESTSIFTDYYFAVDDVLLGDFDSTTSLKVRMEGGRLDDQLLIAEEAPIFEKGEEVILFLYQPNMGGGYNTNDDSCYYITGLNQGVFYDAGDLDFVDCKNQRVSYSDLKTTTERMEVTSASQNRLYTTFIKNAKENLKTGMITQRDYDRMMNEINQYATIIK